jgi:hypothetical protein
MAEVVARVVRRFPVYRVVLSADVEKALVVKNLREAIETKLGLMETLVARWDTLDGTVEAERFNFRPLTTWAGKRGNRPRVGGEIVDVAGGVAVRMEIRTGVWLNLLLLPLMLATFATLVFPHAPAPLVRQVIGCATGVTFALVNHLAETSRMVSILRRVIQQSSGWTS